MPPRATRRRCTAKYSTLSHQAGSRCGKLASTLLYLGQEFITCTVSQSRCVGWRTPRGPRATNHGRVTMSMRMLSLFGHPEISPELPHITNQLAQQILGVVAGARLLTAPKQIPDFAAICLTGFPPRPWLGRQLSVGYRHWCIVTHVRARPYRPFRCNRQWC